MKPGLVIRNKISIVLGCTRPINFPITAIITIAKEVKKDNIDRQFLYHKA